MEQNPLKSASSDKTKSVSVDKTKYIVARRILMCATFSTMILGIPLVAIGFWLALIKHNIVCFRFLEVPIIFIGIALCVGGMVGMVGAYKREAPLLWGYLVLVFLLILLLFAFTVFTFYVINGGGGHQVKQALFLEYRLNDYSLWFQRQMANGATWQGIKMCLQQEGRVCGRLDALYPSREDFYTAPLSPTQSGCCKPPTACQFTFVSPTHWENTTRPLVTSDCGRWDNSLSQLCFACSSCRAGVLQTVKEAWNLVAQVCLAVLICLVLAYSIAWLAFFKGIWDDMFKPESPPI